MAAAGSHLDPPPFLVDALPTMSVVVVDDGILAARLVAGDDDAIGELFDRYAPFVRGVALRVSGSPGMADDVVQEVFTALWAHPERFEPTRGSMRAYLGVQAYRRAIDAVRRETRRRAREAHRSTEDDRGGAMSADGIDAAAVNEVVRDAIGRLPAEQHAVVDLVFWKGHTCREAAVILAIPEGTAKSRLRLAQNKLAEWLRPLAGELV
jgi:RNA polymerase sigma-70 factor (ECF subfamily)